MLRTNCLHVCLHIDWSQYGTFKQHTNKQTILSLVCHSGARVIVKVSGHQYWWLAGGYDREIGHF